MTPEPVASRMTPARWAMLLSLYVTQYLGIGFFLIALVAILRQKGMPLENLGLIYLLGTLWVFKFMWAPLVDRFGLRRVGHYRGWLVAMQAGMVALLLVLAGLDLDHQLPLILALCFLYTFLSATQDIAVDGLAYSLLLPSERGVGNGVQSAGGLLGSVIGGGAILMAYPSVGWRGCMILLALLTGVTLAQVLLFREPGRLGPVSDIRLHAARCWTFWRGQRRLRWLLMLLVYPLGISLGYALMTPILVDAGWGIDRIGFTLNVVGSLIGVLSSLAAGWLIRRVGRRPMLLGAALAQSVGLLALLPAALGQTSPVLVTGAIVVFFAVYSPVTAIMATLMMDHASPRSPATDYTLQYSLYFAGGIVAAMVSALLAGTFGYPAVVLLAAGTAGLALLLSLNFRLPQAAATVATDEETDDETDLAAVPVAAGRG